ncbi:glycosyltransferase family 4 protein [Halomonas beimenensis]|uniref:Alpha-1,3-N-acetylgalactosamine transferase PglA n=1 Tax=Halomonas beimenensis TaxID=475662 RepID=A0A291P8B9_9GAMM|nr:glycosyltransferase family 4 protein [Halomonas beimenensis]ATJ83135.1 alpha-1,3-N-acetylgalactosamine transferase PglA [Halomonas beimenensis]
MARCIIRRPLLVTAITSPLSATLVRGQLQFMKANGFRPMLVSSPGENVRALAATEGIDLVEIPMARTPHPFKDLVSLIRLIHLFLRVRPEIVNAGTPKAGLLCMLAAAATSVRVRIYTIRGFRHESMTGWRRRLMVGVERLTCLASNRVVCVSRSVADLGVRESILEPNGFHVLGLGSSNGIDLERFNPQRKDLMDRDDLRATLGLSPQDRVIGFVGRIIRRKGVDELVAAFTRLKSRHPGVKLLIVGPLENEQPISAWTRQRINLDDDILHLGYVQGVEHYYPLMDLFVLPAYWEGFGNVLLEAAAMGVPTVACDATGCRDAVSDGVSGTLVPVQDVEALEQAMCRYLEDDALRAGHARNAPLWAARFGNVAIWSGLLELYRASLEDAGLGVAGAE